MTGMKQLSERQDRLELKFVEENIDNMQNRVDDKMEEVEKSVLKRAVADSAREVKDRDTRKNNIIIFKAPMSEATELKSRIEDDKVFFQKFSKKG